MKVVAAGTVSGMTLVNKVSKAGAAYQAVDLVVGTNAFTNIVSRPKNLAVGMFVEVVETQKTLDSGKVVTNREIRQANPSQSYVEAPASVQEAPRQAAQPPRAPFEQDKISRQWATSQAICYITLAAQHGAVPKKVLGDNTLLFQMVGQYANLLFNSVQNSSNFEKLPTFTGQVNEASEQQEELV
jgi:hypothetical protein